MFFINNEYTCLFFNLKKNYLTKPFLESPSSSIAKKLETGDLPAQMNPQLENA
jgi:hypothetical protein